MIELTRPRYLEPAAALTIAQIIALLPRARADWFTVCIGTSGLWVCSSRTCSPTPV